VGQPPARARGLQRGEKRFERRELRGRRIHTGQQEDSKLVRVRIGLCWPSCKELTVNKVCHDTSKHYDWFYALVVRQQHLVPKLGRVIRIVDVNSRIVGPRAKIGTVLKEPTIIEDEEIALLRTFHEGYIEESVEALDRANVSSVCVTNHSGIQ
jgi:hypothetical protein